MINLINYGILNHCWEGLEEQEKRLKDDQELLRRMNLGQQFIAEGRIVSREEVINQIQRRQQRVADWRRFIKEKQNLPSRA